MTTLRGITWNHTRGYAPMAVTGQVFSDRHPDVEITWDRRSLWAFGEESLDDVVRSYDLLVVDHPLMGWAATENVLVRMDVALPDGVFERIRHDAVGSCQESYEFEGHHYALAIDAACQVAAARVDLLDGLGEKPPGRWEDVLALARRTRKVAVPFNAIDACSAFLTLCAHLGAPAGRSGTDRFVDHDVAGRAIEMLAELAGLVDPWCATANPIATLNRMALSDDVAYCPLVFGYTNYSREGYVPGPLSFLDIPGVEGREPAGSCLGGAGLAVSAFSTRRELALEYAQLVCDARTQRTDYVRCGGQPASAAAWDDPSANELTGDFFRRTRRTIDAAYVRPRHPGFPDFQTAAANLVRDLIVAPGSSSRDVARVLSRLDDLYRDSFAPPPRGIEAKGGDNDA